MKSTKKSLLIITNLYPLPWEPNRATFNKQQFSLLDEDFTKSLLIPVAFTEWFKNRKSFEQSDNLRFVPYFYTPKFGRRFYSVSMFLSLLIHSGLWIKRKNIDIMFASWAFPDAVATSWLSKLFGTRFFFKVHGSDINEFAKIQSRSSQIKSAAQHATAIMSVSQALKNEMIDLGIQSEKIFVIYNGVNHNKFSSNPAIPVNNSPKNEYILYVGNLKRDKGIFELLEGFAQVHQQFPSIRLTYAGPGTLKDDLLLLANSLGVQHKVTFLGAVNHSDLPTLMQNAKLLALPSYNEGVPNVVLEAMSCGIPVVATCVGGIPEVVDEAICGVIIAPKNNDAVAQGLTSVLTKTWSKEKIKQHSLQFSWEKNKTQLIQMLTLKGNSH